MILRQEGSTRDRLNFAFQRAVSRPIQDDEAAVLEELLNNHIAEYTASAAAAAELLKVGEKPAAGDLPTPEMAAWTSVARTILNLHETITRN